MQYIYKKYYSTSTTRWTWRKYNLDTTKTYTWRQYNNERVITSYTERITSNTSHDWKSGYTGYTFSTTDGLFRRNGELLNEIQAANRGIPVYAPIAINGTKTIYSSRNGYPYQRHTSDPNYSDQKGTYRGTVSSTSSTKYPTNGKSGSYWYDTRTSSTSYSRGSYIGKVSSSSSTTYPTDGKFGSYWYDTRTSSTSYSQGDYIGEVTAEDGGYPNNGRHSDGYWYVKDRAANQAPTISGRDEDLGTVTGPFTKTFSVDDLDSNQELTVDVKLNGLTIRTINNATRKETYSINITQEMYDDLELNVTNTIAITVSDTAGTSAVRRWTFKRVNTNPTIEVQNSNLGQQNNPFSFKFTPNDADGDSISVKIYLDDIQIEDVGNVTRGQERTYSIGKIDFARIKNGNHKIKIEVTDSNNAKGYGYIDFSKNITHAWYKFHRELTAQPAEITVQPMLELADGAELTIKVCNNALDTNPTWEEIPEVLIGQVYTFTNMTKTNANWAVGVEVRIDRGTATKDSYFYGFVGAYR